MTELSATEARESFSEVVSRAAYGKERVILTKNGRPVAAVVPVEDLERLEALEPSKPATATSKALAALKQAQRLAVQRGLHQLSDEEIDAEVRAVRAARRKR
jgi:prevent-host-death family protein